MVCGFLHAAVTASGTGDNTPAWLMNDSDLGFLDGMVAAVTQHTTMRFAMTALETTMLAVTPPNMVLLEACRGEILT